MGTSTICFIGAKLAQRGLMEQQNKMKVEHGNKAKDQMLTVFRDRLHMTGNYLIPLLSCLSSEMY